MDITTANVLVPSFEEGIEAVHKVLLRICHDSIQSGGADGLGFPTKRRP